MKTIEFECKKDGLRQTQDGGLKLTLSVHPQDVSPELLIAQMGQQFMCVLALIDGGEPVQVEYKQKEKNSVTAAGNAHILIKDPTFMKFCNVETIEQAKEYVCNQCGVKSFADLNTDPEAAKAFEYFRKTFYIWSKGVAV